MNKRMKKKKALIEQVYGTKAAMDIALNLIAELMCENVEQGREIKALRNIVEQNAQASNNRFEQLESENKVLRSDLDKGVLEFKKSKRPLLGRLKSNR